MKRYVSDVRWWLGAAGVLIFASISIAWFLLSRPPAIIDSAITEKVSYKVYAPSKLPSGYRLNDQGAESGGVISYSMQQGDSTLVIVTLQAAPAGFNMASMVGDSKISSTSTDLGDMYDMSVAGTSRFLVNTGGTLLFVTSPERLETNFVRDLVNSMRSVK